MRRARDLSVACMLLVLLLAATLGVLAGSAAASGITNAGDDLREWRDAARNAFRPGAASGSSMPNASASHR